MQVYLSRLINLLLILRLGCHLLSTRPTRHAPRDVCRVSSAWITPKCDPLSGFGIICNKMTAVHVGRRTQRRKIGSERKTLAAGSSSAASFSSSLWSFHLSWCGLRAHSAIITVVIMNSFDKVKHNPYRRITVSDRETREWHDERTYFIWQLMPWSHLCIKPPRMSHV